ncbi:MAG: 3-isopropylmalate dehydrogenase [Firmicutes bacterium]|nr:3-isopropylmalate dehydrogenase [Bacillota bacterium]
MKNIVVLSGDGIGPEICTEAVKVLSAASKKHGFELNFIYKDFGGCAIDHYGTPFPFDTRSAVGKADAVLLGAVGGPAWDKCAKRPESGLLELRSSLGAYANLRPARIYKALEDSSPLKREICQGTDILMVRELTGGIYFGKRGTSESGDRAFDTEEYSGAEIERIARVAFEQARSRRRRLCSVDKANILDSSKLWRRCVEALAKQYPDVEVTHMYVDNAAMQLVRCPSQFDVILCSNMFGDILSDEASMICGSIGTMPSASIGGKAGIFEPIHGSAPDIAGQNAADPIGAVLSGAMLLRSLGYDAAAQDIERAVELTLNDGIFTRDLSPVCVTCSEMGDAIAARL